MDQMQAMTDTIVRLMEQGDLPWQKPWDGKTGHRFLQKPYNVASGYLYTRENLAYLTAISYKIQEGTRVADGRFCTFNQANSLGWCVKKGSHGHYIKQGFFATKDKDGNELPEEERHWVAIGTIVFHASQLCVGEPVRNAADETCTGAGGRAWLRPTEQPVPPPKAVKGYTHGERYEIAELMLEKSGAVIVCDQSDAALYRAGEDVIHLPPKEAFLDLDQFYATALHELGHWTGHPSRLNRLSVTERSSREDYAKEELRAEMASMYLSAELGLPFRAQDTAAYTQSWLKVLRNDKFEFARAAVDAQNISEYLLGMIPEHMRKREVVAEQKPVAEAERQTAAMRKARPRRKEPEQIR